MVQHDVPLAVRPRVHVQDFMNQDAKLNDLVALLDARILLRIRLHVDAPGMLGPVEAIEDSCFSLQASRAICTTMSP